MKLVVEENGERGWSSYRVPGIVTTRNKELLLTYEGRDHSGQRRTLFLNRYRIEDDCIVPVEMRKEMVTPLEGELLHNPLLISDHHGRIYFFWCQDYGRLYLRISEDDGKSFGAQRELTRAINGFRSQWPVTLWAIAPGHGIVQKNGRVVLPLWMSRGENAHLPACFACLTSDDQGQTWKCSNIVTAGDGIGDPTEASVAERRDGSLIATLRHEIPGCRKRAFCVSEISGDKDSGVVWKPAYIHEELPDPICGASIVSMENGTLAFLNCAYEDEPALSRQKLGENVRWSLDARQNLTLRTSIDDGSHWSSGVRLTHEGGASDMAVIGKRGGLACFYEEGWEDGNCIYNKRLVLEMVKI